jgi:hypothetical protein
MRTEQEKLPDEERIVKFLAEEAHAPIDDVARLYEHERSSLAVGARVTKFVHIFAIRNVQKILHQRSVDSQPRTGRGGNR